MRGYNTGHDGLSDITVGNAGHGDRSNTGDCSFFGAGSTQSKSYTPPVPVSPDDKISIIGSQPPLDAGYCGNSNIADLSLFKKGSQQPISYTPPSETDTTPVTDTELSSVSSDESLKSFKYSTWNDILDPNNKDELGIDYYANHETLKNLFSEGQRLKQIPAKKRPPGSADMLEVYDTIYGSSKKFVSSNLDDKIRAMYTNRSLTKEQSSFIYESVVWLGILYQLEIGAFVASCCESKEYDTLFYQNSVGPAVRNVVSRYNSKKGIGQNEFSVRQRPKLNLTDVSNNGKVKARQTTSQEDLTEAKKVEGVSFDTILRLNKLREIIDNHIYDQVKIESQFSSDFENKKVVATISVKCKSAEAKDYNSGAGLKLFMESLDPRLNKLFLVRVDTAHVWTNSQVYLLEEAAKCESYEDFYANHLSQIFAMRSQTSLLMDKDGLPTINKESELWKQLVDEVLKEGVDWESTYFADILKVLSENHFVDGGMEPRYTELASQSELRWRNFKYKSKLEQEKIEADKLKSIASDLEDFIDGWLNEVQRIRREIKSKRKDTRLIPGADENGADETDGDLYNKFFENKNPRECLENLCFLLIILEKEFIKDIGLSESEVNCSREDIICLQNLLRDKIDSIIEREKGDEEINYLLDFAETFVAKRKEHDITEEDIQKVTNSISFLHFLLDKYLNTASTDEEKELSITDWLRGFSSSSNKTLPALNVCSEVHSARP